MRNWLPILAALTVLSASASLSAQGRHRRPAPVRASNAAVDHLLQTAIADQLNHAFTSAERAYTAALQLDPDNARARTGLLQARDSACHEDVDHAVAAQQWPQAAARLRGCATADANTLARIAQLAAIQTALAHGAWTSAATAMQQLAPEPAQPSGPLAPAYAAFGAGHPRMAARLSAALAAPHHDPAAGPENSPALAANRAHFDAFLRNRARRRAWHAAAWPLLAAYLAALGGSLFWGLRRLSAMPSSGAASAASAISTASTEITA